MKKAWGFFWLKVTIALLTMFLLVKTVDFRDIVSAFRNPQDSVFILLAFLLFFPNLTLQCYRWYYLLKLIQPEATFRESVVSLLGGMVVGFVTPGRIGEVGRFLFLWKGDRVQAIGLVFLDKLYAFVAILVGGVLGLFFLVGHLFDYTTFIVWPMGVVGLLLVAGVLTIAMHPDWLRTFLYNFSITLPVRDKLKRFIGFMDRFRREEARRLLGFSFLLYGIFILQFCFFAFAFQPIPWTSVLMATTSTILTKSLLPISLADLGIREGAAVFFFSKLQVGKVTAFNSSLLLFAVNILLPTFLGLFMLPRLGWKER